MKELPTGWIETTVGHIGEYFNGRGFKSSEWRETGRPIIRIQNLTGSGSTFNYYNGMVDDRQTARPGDLLVSWAATLGVYVWDGPEAVINQHIFKVESRIDKKFHRYLLDHVLRHLQAKTHGSGMVHITRSRFEETPVLVPSSPDEQRRIVEVIEEQFSRLDAGVESLQRAKRNVTRLRGSILTSAVEGRLVAQDPSEGTGKGLVARISKDRAARSAESTRKPADPSEAIHEAPISWGSASLEALTDPIRLICYGILKPKTKGALTVPYVEVRDIRGGRIATSGLNRTTEELHAQFPRSHLIPGDVLVAVRGSYDRSAVVPDELDGANISRDVARIAPMAGFVPEYLVIYLHSPTVLAHLKGIARGVAVKGVNIGSMRELGVMIPPTEEQHRIVAEVERQFSIIDAMSETIDTGLARAGTLRRSILSQAFSGKLTGAA